MLFRKKGWLRKEFDDQLMETVKKLKCSWSSQRLLLEKSLDPSAEVIIQGKMEEAKYFFLYKEVKHRNIVYKNK
jgi:hypothetical protein